MKHVLFLFCFFSQYIFSQSLPEGYIIQYTQNFNSAGALSDFRASGSGVLSLPKSGSNSYLKVSDTSAVNQGKTASLAIMKDFIFGDFIIEFDIMVPSGGDTLEGPFALFSYRDASNYYYATLSSSWYDPTGGIFMVSKNKNSAVRKDTLNSWKVSQDKWTHFRIERNITARTVKVFAADIKNPVLQARDPQLVMGMLGFGTFAGTFYIDNIRIWAPTFIPAE